VGRSGNKETKRKITRAIPGILLILIVAGLVTYGATLAVAELTKPKPVVTKTVVVKEEPKVEEPKEETPAPTPEPTPAPVTPTATTNSFVYLRPTASTSGTPLKDLQAGTVVQYTTKTTGLWQKVTVDGVTGYVYRKWLTY